MNKRRRRAMIKLLAETGAREEGSLVADPDHGEIERRRDVGRRAGAEWVAYHRARKG